MSKRRTFTAFGSLLGVLVFIQPVLACMEHEEDWYANEGPAVPSAMPPEEIVCDGDLSCPSGMICEPVSCCEAEGCECPAAVCEVAATGAQGRDCELDMDCGVGFTCLFDTASGHEPLGWCEALDSPMPVVEGRDLLDGLPGCQGGSDDGLPLSVAFAVLFGVVIRRRQLAC
jgi:hypothetical protein